MLPLLPCQKDFPLQHQKGELKSNNIRHTVLPLREWLAQHPEYTVVGSPRRFFYDAPYVPEPAKRSEIQIPIRRVDG